MDDVALAATIGGSVVALAGVGETGWSAWLSRKSARELTTAQHAHEQKMARGERLFERRASVYEDVVGALGVMVERANQTEPILTIGNPPDPPEPPTVDEWLDLEARLGTFGSVAVEDSFKEFHQRLMGFYGHVMVLRQMRDQQATTAETFTSVQDARVKVRESLDSFKRAVRDDLDSL